MTSSNSIWNSVQLLRQREREQGAASGDRDELPPVHGVTDRGGANGSAERDMPEILAGVRVERDEVTLTVAGEHKAASGREHAGPCTRVLTKIPPDRAALGIDRADR